MRGVYGDGERCSCVIGAEFRCSQASRVRMVYAGAEGSLHTAAKPAAAAVKLPPGSQSVVSGFSSPSGGGGGLSSSAGGGGGIKGADTDSRSSNSPGVSAGEGNVAPTGSSGSNQGEGSGSGSQPPGGPVARATYSSMSHWRPVTRQGRSGWGSGGCCRAPSLWGDEGAGGVSGLGGWKRGSWKGRSVRGGVQRAAAGLAVGALSAGRVAVMLQCANWLPVVAVSALRRAVGSCSSGRAAARLHAFKS